jgi:uncharacterized UPF0146 family protein
MSSWPSLGGLEARNGRDEAGDRPAEEQERRNQDRFASTIVIAAAIIAAVRLARDDITSPSPRVYAAIADSVSLARKILQRVIGG